jgi:hypothetical protein
MVVIDPLDARPLDTDRTTAVTSDPEPGGTAAHRAEVVRRLLDRGLSPATLRTMLPGFSALIDELAARRPAAADDHEDPPSP